VRHHAEGARRALIVGHEDQDVWGIGGWGPRRAFLLDRGDARGERDSK
jgi:hypothetical protein